MRAILTLLLILSALSSMAKPETKIFGHVTDGSNGTPLQGVNIMIEGTVLGTSTNKTGYFELNTKIELPLILRFSIVGYHIQKLEVKSPTANLIIEMIEAPLIGDQVVISASRIEESIMKSPVSIEKMDIITLRESPAPNFYDALAELPGVFMIQNSLGFKTVHARGRVSNGSNVSFVQRIDGMDNTLPFQQFSAGNSLGITGLDVESIEMVPGTSSTIYGPNSFNGTLLIHSKDPFEYPGLSAQLQTGVTIQDAAGTKPFVDFALRYAKVFRDKWAIKFSGSVLNAEEWHATSLKDLDRSPFNESVRGPDSPSYDAANKYGDENARTIPLTSFSSNLQSIHVSRTGYNESDLVDYDAQSQKVDATIKYRVAPNLEASYNYRYGNTTTMYQGSNRFYAKDLQLQQHKIEFNGDGFYIRAYNTSNNYGDSYDTRLTANLINQDWKLDNEWFDEYAAAYVSAVESGHTTPDAHIIARSETDRERLVPGSQEFQRVLEAIIQTSIVDGGAKTQDNSSLFHTEANYNFGRQFKWTDIQVGGSFRKYSLDTQGESLDSELEPIVLNEYGLYVIANRTLLNEKVIINASLRWDNHQNFSSRLSPRIGTVFSFGNKNQHNLRASFQTGFRNPTNVEQYRNIPGFPNLIGAAKDFLSQSSFKDLTEDHNIEGFDILTNSYEANSVLKFQSTFNPEDLMIVELDPVQPETVTAWELGYKGYPFECLFLDVSGYYQTYTDMIRNITTVTPATGSVTDESGINDLINQTFGVFNLSFNLDDRAHSYGINVNVNHNLSRNFYWGANYSYEELDLGDIDPAVLPGFNKPDHRLNVYVGRRITNNLGFRMNYRWYDSYVWPGRFFNGTVDSFGTLDLQLSYKLPSINSILKIGGANVLKQEYSSIVGSGSVGAQYYISLTFDEFLN